MKILLIHHFGGVGGGTNSCLDIASLLVSQGHDVIISIPFPDNSIKKYCAHNNIVLEAVNKPVPCFTYHNASCSLFREFLKHLMYRRYLAWWKSHINKINPDLVMLNSMAQLPLSSIMKSRKCVCFIRETKKYGGWIGNTIIKNLMTQMSGLIFLTEFDKKDWAVSSSIKQFVLPDFVSLNLFNIPNYDVSNLKKSLNIDGCSKIILYLGGLNYAKGGFDLIDAYKIVRRKCPNTKLIILGNTYDSVLKKRTNAILRPFLFFSLLKYTRIIKNINHNKQDILLVGPIPDVNIWYYISDIVVFPVRKVHQARPVYEAGFYNKPVILPDYANFKESLQDGYNGMFYKKGNVKSLAQTLIDVLQSEDKISYGQHNYLMYKAEHSEGYALGRLANIIEKL